MLKTLFLSHFHISSPSSFEAARCQGYHVGDPSGPTAILSASIKPLPALVTQSPKPKDRAASVHHLPFEHSVGRTKLIPSPVSRTETSPEVGCLV